MPNLNEKITIIIANVTVDFYTENVSEKVHF